MRWAVDYIAENRPALSQWYPEWKAQFDECIEDSMEEGRRKRKSPFIITEGDAIGNDTFVSGGTALLFCKS
jgi:hypothetical protein